MIHKKKSKRKTACDYTQQRNRDLRNRFIEQLGKSGRTIKEVFATLTTAPAERFYISEERAYILVLEKRRKGDGWGEGMLPTRKRMIEEIDRRVRLLMEREPGMTFKDAIFEVVNSPAPCFYLTRRSIRTLLYLFGA